MALIGGQYNESSSQTLTYLINLNEPQTVFKTIQCEKPFKWNVTNYDWDMVSSGSGGGGASAERYLQTVCDLDF